MRTMIAILGALLIGGCGGNPGGGPNGNDPGTNPGTDPGTTGNTTFSADIDVTLPIEAEVSVDGATLVGCEGLNCTFEVTQDGTHNVEAEAANYLFVPRSVTIDREGDVVPVDWNCEGCWGAAPNGEYVRARDGRSSEIRTYVAGSVVTIDFGGLETIVTGYDLGEVGPNAYLVGSISQDLSVIEWAIYDYDGNWLDGDTLTIVQ